MHNACGATARLHPKRITIQLGKNEENNHHLVAVRPAQEPMCFRARARNFLQMFFKKQLGIINKKKNPQKIVFPLFGGVR
jgi:hypothetical protein